VNCNSTTCNVACNGQNSCQGNVNCSASNKEGDCP
jgi:hypothetical protein